MSVNETVEPEPMQLEFKWTKPPSKYPKLDRELEAFYDLLPDLLQTHRDQFVAIHEGKVVAVGPDAHEALMGARRLYPRTALLVRKVTVKPPDPVRIFSPRLVKNILGEVEMVIDTGKGRP